MNKANESLLLEHDNTITTRENTAGHFNRNSIEIAQGSNGHGQITPFEEGYLGRIAFIDIFDPIPLNSGGDWYRYQLLENLCKYGEVTDYCTKKIDDKYGFTPQSIPFNRVYFKSPIDWGRVSDKMGMIQPEMLFDRSKINDIKADVVFVIAELYHIGRYIAKKNQAPLVLVMHNIEWEYLRNIRSMYWIPMRFYEDYILKRVDAITAISARDHDYAKKVSQKNNVLLIPPEINMEIFNPDGPRFDFGNDRFNLLFYGSLDREQNIAAIRDIKDVLIPKMKKIGLMKKVRINIFGSGKPPRDLNLENDPDIRFYGEVEDPSPYIRGTDVVLVPVRNRSGVKMRVIESFACGKTVIGTPEAAEGLPPDLKKNIIVCRNADEIVQEVSRLIILKKNEPEAYYHNPGGEPSIKILYDFLRDLYLRSSNHERRAWH